MRDDYEILGVQRGASKEEIRRRYLELSKQYHPDKHRDNPLSDLAAERFREIKDAYERLTNPDATRATASASSEDAGEATLVQDIYVHLSRRQWNEAIRAADRLHRIHPTAPESHLYKAAAHMGLGDAASAASSFESARRAGWQPEPDDYFAYVQCLVELGRYQQAVPCLDWLISTSGEVPDVLAMRAFCLEGCGDQRAKRDWDRLAIIDPNHEALVARRQAWKVGTTYVNKSDAASLASAGACGLCALLECIFDCC